jgi:hypothetical protein
VLAPSNISITEAGWSYRHGKRCHIPRFRALALFSPKVWWRVRQKQPSHQLLPFGKTLRRRLLPGCCSTNIRKTLSQAGTAPRARGMCGRSWDIPEGAAHLLNSLVVEPTLRKTLFDRPAVGANLAAPDTVVSALMVEHEESDGVRLLVE